MFKDGNFNWLNVGICSLFLGLGAAYVVLESEPVVAQKNQQMFPDVKENYWARPFIQNLAEKRVLKGYKDGTFRPNQIVDRDEFAAMIRQAFEERKITEIPSGSYFKDVPKGYWAAPPIEEAYETGFMKEYPGNLFKPQQGITRTQAIIDLTKGMNLDYKAKINQAPQAAVVPQKATPAKQSKIAKNRLLFPLASTALMQPLMPVIASVPQQQKPANATPQQAAKTATGPGNNAALNLLKSYYQDADKIPKNAVNNVAAATQADIVVNYPDSRFFKPNEMLTRGSAAALIHQALVYRGELQPLPQNSEAAKYIPTSAEKRNSKAEAK